ncbi:MAG TPA: tetratricopeptide repeat protein [Polyangiaceae bacterium]|nr:tetratricopeptide repeat protein [Polyangiaceae bacterium]
MAIDREKILQAAAKLVDKKKYDKAIVEYQKIVQSDPSDARTLLKIGDLQTRLEDYTGAIATYDQVAQFYLTQGFQLKAIAVFKQVRELIRKHAPELAQRYAHITPRLADIYAQLGLTSDALSAYDEVATALQKNGRDREAVAVFRKIVALDAKNPISLLRLAEAMCRVQDVDAGIASFWSAAQLLLSMQRAEDALKVIERILHFRQDPLYARAAAELYLKRDQPQAGMLALAKLQIAFQANPKDLDTLALLAQAFEVIGQGDKAFSVHLEMARLAREQGKPDLFREIVTHLKTVAPLNDQVLALERLGPRAGASSLPPPPGSSSMPVLSSGAPPAPVSSLPPPPPLPRTSAPAHVEVAETVDLDDEVEYLEDGPESLAVESLPLSAAAESIPPSGVAIPDDLPAAEERDFPQSFRPSSHAHKAIVDAEAFRRLGLLDKAVEVLHIALELDPNSVPIRQKLREILVEAGEREPAIVETLNIAIIHLHNQDADSAEPMILEVLEIEPDHPDARNLLDHVYALRANRLEPADGHLESYDLEGVPPSSAIRRDSDPLPAFPLGEATDTPPHSRRPLPEAIEEVLEEAEFFASQGLYADAEAILTDLLRQAPDHVLLLERLAEVQQAHAEAKMFAGPSTATTDNAFDIAASLDVLDGFDGETQTRAPALANQAEEVDVDQVFAKFKEGIKATIDDADAATHYDLGLAYKEMGLLPDARAEFELASRDPQRACMCLYMIGSIFAQQGDLIPAIDAYLLALEAQVKTPDQQKNLEYELAALYEQRGDPASAIRFLQRIAKKDPQYRDVSARIRTLGGALPTHDTADDEVDAAFDNLFG